MIWLSILVVMLVFFIIFSQSILMIAASEYITNTEIYFENKKLSYLRYIKFNFKKLFKSIEVKKQTSINYVSFCANYLMILFLSLPVILNIYSSVLDVKISFLDLDKINIFYTCYACLIIYSSRMVTFISSDKKLDLNKMILKGLVAFALVLLNFSFTSFLITKIEVYSDFKLLVKILLFFNAILAIYVFDNFTKHKKKNTLYQFKILDKISLYYMLVGVFFLLNSSEAIATKFIYYSISIYLIDFLAAYINKTLGYIKLNQAIQVSYEYVFVYYLLFYIIFLGIYGF